ncbi:ATP-binding protein [Pseudomonas sp. Marseille-QA0892]
MRHLSPPGLRQWMWRAFVRSALVPLLLVEIGLISVYLFSNGAIREAQVEHLRETALSDLGHATNTQARVIEEKLERVARTTDFYRQMTGNALAANGEGVAETLDMTTEGVRYSATDIGGAASFYSSVTPPEQHDLAKVARLATLDPMVKALAQQNPLIASLYFNSWDHYNRIYPWLDTASAFDRKAVPSEHSFYYLADAAHNPARKVVWTDVYLDPAHRGWLTSAVAPVYRGNFLEGVVGIDITVSGLIKELGTLEVPWNGYTMLVNDRMNVMALPAEGERDLGLPEPTEYAHEGVVASDTFRPTIFNLGNHTAAAPLLKAMTEASQGVTLLTLDGQPRLVAWKQIPPTGWYLMSVVDESAVFAKTDALAAHYSNIGYLLIAGLVFFYAVFFLYLGWRSRRLSNTLLEPIAGIRRMMTDIGRGHWRPSQPKADVLELKQVIEETASMGEKLERSEEGLRKANADAQASSLAKSRFISSISHELRTPLNAIQGFAQLLQLEQRQQQDKGADFLGEIIAASRHLNQLLGDILEWSGAQNERRRIDLVPIVVSRLFRESAQLVKLELEAQGLVLKINPPTPGLGVRGDARRLRQVLLNLLSNAIKYNKPGGTVELGWELKGDVVRLWVGDDGIGIDQSLHERLFEPFQRLGQENSAIQGTGIGLSLCREYVTQMKGRIGVDSAPGEGSRFWVDLPFAELPALPEQPAREPVSRPMPGRARLVYVEDDRASQMLIRKALKDMADIEVISDGLEAWQQLIQSPPDLLLVDLNVPGMRGDELVSRVRRYPGLEALPILMLTAAISDDFARLSGLGCQALLHKPVDLAQLRETIRALLSP